MAITATAELNKLGQLAFKEGVAQEQLTVFLKAGYVPQPKGLTFHRYAREADRPDGPTRIAMGGTRGQAKSHAVFAQAVLDDMQRFDGLKVLYLRKIGKKAGESFEDLRRKVCQFVEHEVKNNILYLPNGSFMVMGGFRSDSEIDSYLGLEYGLVIIEDATTLTKHRVDAIFGSLRTSREDYRPRAYLSFNPGGVGHAWARKMFYDPYKLDQETGTRFVHVQMGDNAFVNKEYADYLDSLSGWMRRAWRDGDMEISAGQFFVNWDAGIHVLNFDYNSYWHTWAALDYGFIHWLVFYLIAQDGDGNIYFLDEHASRRWLVPQNAEAIHNMLGRYALNMGHLHRIVAGHDVFAQRGMSKTIAEEYAEHGVSLERANLDRINGAARLLSLLGSRETGTPARVFVHPRCAKLIETLPRLQIDPNRPEDVLKENSDPDSGEGGDDAYDAARYGLMAAPATGDSIFNYASYGRR